MYFFLGKFQAWNRKRDQWVDVVFDGYRYECYNKVTGETKYVEEEDVKIAEPAHTEDTFKINCPSVIYNFSPDKGKALYEKIKFTSNNRIGIQSQCVVVDTYKSQKYKDQ